MKKTTVRKLTSVEQGYLLALVRELQQAQAKLQGCVGVLTGGDPLLVVNADAGTIERVEPEESQDG